VPAFADVAPFYDELMRHVPYRMWASYYQLLLAQLGVEPQTMLDVCCGTGKLCELLAAEGYKLTGFDIAEPMIHEARRKAKTSGLDIRYECMDAAGFELGERFDAAFSFFDSLNYIAEPEKLAKAVRQVGKHLNRSGSFIFDLNTAYAFEKSMFDQQRLHPSAKVRYVWKGDWDAATRLIKVNMRFWVNGREFEETHVQRAYSDAEIRGMLEAAGFSEIRSFNSYTLDPPRANSDRVHYTAIKP